MSLKDRFANAAGVVWFALGLLYMLVRALLAIGLGIALALLLAQTPFALPDEGATAFGVGVALVACYIAMPLSLGSVALHWVVLELLRLPLVALFVAVAVACRVGLEKLPSSPTLVSLLEALHLEVLAATPALWRVPLSIGAGVVVIAVITAFLKRNDKQAQYDGPNSDETVLRGPRRVPYSTIRERNRRRYEGEPCVSWCLTQLSVGMARLGLRLVGATGSGKTILLRVLLESFAPLVRRADGKFRAYILDVKNDYRVAMRHLLADASNVALYVIHPGDQDSHCWDVGVDVTKETALAFAAAFFRKAPEALQDPFWIRLMHLTVVAVINGLIERFGTQWTLATLVKQMTSEVSIREAMGWDSTNHKNVQALQLLDEQTDDRLRGSLFFTIVEQSGEYGTIAAAMELQYERGQRCSISHWATSSAILVFGWDKRRKKEMQAFHAAFFAWVCNTIFDVSAEDGGQLILLDELASAGPIGDDLAMLSREGRDLNVIPVLAYHSRPALNLAMGEKEAAAAIAEQRFVATLGCADDTTAEDASRGFGMVEIERTQTSTTTPQASGSSSTAQESTSTTTVRETKPLISAAQIMALPLIDPRGTQGPTLFAREEDGSVYQVHYPMAAVRRELAKLPKFHARRFGKIPELRSPAPQPPTPRKAPKVADEANANGDGATSMPKQKRSKRSILQRLEDLDLG